MLPYVILMFAPLLVYQVSVTRQENRNGKEWSFSIGKEPHILHNSMIVPMFFTLLFLLLALRNVSLGRDLPVYETYFAIHSGMAFEGIFEADMDILYVFLSWLVGRFTDNFHTFLVVVAAVTILPIAKVYSEDKQYGFLKIVLFMNMSVFIMLFSGLRQSLAIAFGLIAYEYVKKKKPLRFLLFALIAFGFHHTAFIVFLYYPVYYLRLRKIHLWFVIPAIAAVLVFNKQIFTWAADIAFSVFGDKYDVEVEETGAYLMIVLFALFAFAAYFFPDEKKMDAETAGLRNFLLMALIFQCFAPVHALAMRMNYYFIIFVPMVVPKIFKYTKDNIKDIAKITKGIVVGFFVVYYLVTTYESCKTGISDLHTYPYVPFWEY